MRHIRLFLIFLCAFCSFQFSVPARSGVTGSHHTDPIIGISASYTDGRSSAGDDYCTAVRKAGGIPVILPAVNCAQDAENVIATVDGLLMTGGEDVNPARYGETPVNATVHVNNPRDTSDFLLLAAAKERSLPLMGICRGAQIVNIFYGGSLIQDIPSQIGTQVNHKQKESKATGTHWIYLEDGSAMKRLLGADSLMVNTLHHQAVKKLAPPFILSATAADGIIEAYETPAHSKQQIICTQFHPEGFIYAGDDTFLPLFQEFIRRCSIRR